MPIIVGSFVAWLLIRQRFTVYADLARTGNASPSERPTGQPTIAPQAGVNDPMRYQNGFRST